MLEYNRREFLKKMSATAGALGLCGCGGIGPMSGKDPDKPNFVIIFTDDQGYADVGCYGAKGFSTPNVDRMAAEGMKFTDFYSAAAICSPSRAALLTGCYPPRVSVPRVLFPRDNVGLNTDEVTIADILKARGYATACIGKWHLGHLPQFLPTRQGFDYYFGIPYSNDMWPKNSKKYPELPLIENEKTIELNPDQRLLTKRYTEKTVEFIKTNKDKPFFIYLPHTMPHIPLFVSEKFQGKSERGLYGDVIEEIDWSVGEILKTLKQLGLDENTLVIFTSDNGPWLSKGERGGSALPLRDGKFSTYEGGMRVPCIMRWPGRIPPGSVSSAIAATIDFLPTLAKFAGATLPTNRIIDGRDLSVVFEQSGAGGLHEAFFYYSKLRLNAVRSGKWKLVFRSRKNPQALYNLDEDISEQHDVSKQHPDIVSRLTSLADKMREDIGDSAKKIKGKNVRPIGQA
ncbi:MAG: sulfatase family protein [Planctomycetota bacterium]|jgi:arylsulfatase A-like enzyme